MSAVGVLSPVPGTGQALKAARVADRVVEGAKAADHAVAAGVAAKAGRETIVIGEGQATRVIPTAKEVGATWYQPRQGAAAENFMKNNERWINKKMDEGCRILDCGAAPGRKGYPGPTSPNYKMELEQISKRNYPTEKIKAVGERRWC